jgi:quinol monooxygenase YgiN
MEKIFAIARFGIKPGHAGDFFARARASMEAARTDLRGTHLYEWFHQNESNNAVVIEAYDGVEAVAHHGKCAGATIPPLLEHAASDVLMLGDVPEKMVAGMGRVFGQVRYFGKRAFGKLNDPAPGKLGPLGPGAIYIIARFWIAPGKAAEFRDLASRIVSIVRDREPGTLAYEWFLNAPETECMVLDIYRDMAALQAHMGNVGPLMSGMKELGTSEVELYGALPPEALAMLAKQPGTRYAGALFQGVL